MKDTQILKDFEWFYLTLKNLERFKDSERLKTILCDPERLYKIKNILKDFQRFYLTPRDSEKTLIKSSSPWKALSDI